MDTGTVKMSTTVTPPTPLTSESQTKRERPLTTRPMCYVVRSQRGKTSSQSWRYDEFGSFCEVKVLDTPFCGTREGCDCKVPVSGLPNRFYKRGKCLVRESPIFDDDLNDDLYTDPSSSVGPLDRSRKMDLLFKVS